MGGSFERERRLAKASLLYADAVSILGLATPVAMMTSGLSTSELDPACCSEDLYAHVALSHDESLKASDTLSYVSGPAWSDHTRELLRLADGEAGLVRAFDTGLVVPPNIADTVEAVFALPADSAYLRTSKGPLWGHLWRADDAGARNSEAILATALLGELEGFPDASVDTLLDVRERLRDPLTHFRAAVRQAASDVADAVEPGGDYTSFVRDIRLRLVDPAVQEIRDELTALSARQTLLRLAKDKVAMASAGASITMAAGAGGGLAGLAGLAHGAVAAPMLAAAAAEVELRTQTRTTLRSRPYWLLHEAGEAVRP